MKVLGTEIRWAAPTETRELAQVTDIGVAFSSAMAAATRGDDTAIPAVYRGFQFLSDTVAGLHLEEYERGQLSSVTPRILEQPNPAETYHDTINAVMNSLLFRGNAYLIPRTRDDVGFPTSCIVANPDEVSAEWDRNKIYPVYKWREQPMSAPDEIIPIPLNRWPGRVDGISPVTACRLMLEGAHSEQTLATQLMVEDSTPPGTINLPEKLSLTEAKKILDVWEETHKARKRPAVLGGGASYTSIAFSPVDAQFLESREFSVQQIGRMLGLHGLFLLVSSGDSLTYSTTEGIMRLVLTTTVAPTYLERIEQAFSRMLPTGRMARFNTDQLLRADLTARYQAYQVAVQAGFLTIADVRNLEGLPPLPAGASNGRVFENA